MGGARALIASLGASISLVAGAAIALFLFSVVFALPGLTGSSDAPRASAAEVLESQSVQPRAARGGGAREASTSVVISAPARRSARPARQASGARRAAPAAKPSFNADLPDLNSPVSPAPEAAAQAPSTAAIGDSVVKVGDVATATVKGTGAALAEATAPLLGPPVAQAIQDVIDLLTSVLEGATGALGGALDKAVPR